MKLKSKILILLLGILVLGTIICTNQVKAVIVEEIPEGVWVHLDILSPKGTSMQYRAPESGGPDIAFNSALDYTNCTIEIGRII